MMAEREDGYYWILCDYGEPRPEWEVAEWYGGEWQQCGSDVSVHPTTGWPIVVEVGERIERAAVAAEREACAKIADDELDMAQSVMNGSACKVASRIAANIRARK